MRSKGGTLRAQWLGKLLRDLRESADLTLKDAGDHLMRDPSTISRLETGLVPVRLLEVRELMNLYGVDDSVLRAGLEQLTRDIWVKGWWDGYTRNVHMRVIDLAWLESRAQRIREFSPLVLPGLLQTRDHAEAVTRIAGRGPVATDDQIRNWVEFRVKRQEVLEHLEYEAILDEAALQRVVGDAGVMRDQLAHVLELSHRPNITIRVHPFSAGALASPDGAFILLSMAPPFSVVAQVPTEAGAIYVEMPQVRRFEAAYTQLQRAALDVDDSRTWIKTRMEQLA